MEHRGRVGLTALGFPLLRCYPALTSGSTAVCRDHVLSLPVSSMVAFEQTPAADLQHEKELPSALLRPGREHRGERRWGQAACWDCVLHVGYESSHSQAPTTVNCLKSCSGVWFWFGSDFFLLGAFFPELAKCVPALESLLVLPTGRDDAVFEACSFLQS